MNNHFDLAHSGRPLDAIPLGLSAMSIPFDDSVHQQATCAISSNIPVHASTAAALAISVLPLFDSTNQQHRQQTPTDAGIATHHAVASHASTFPVHALTAAPSAISVPPFFDSRNHQQHCQPAPTGADIATHHAVATNHSGTASFDSVESKKAKLMSSSWKASFPFEIRIDPIQQKPEIDDISKYFEAIFTGMIIRFDNSKYPPTDNGFLSLKVELQKSARNHMGTNLVVSHSTVNEKTGVKSWTLRCDVSLIYQGNKVDKSSNTVKTPTNIRNSTLKNDRNNTRGNKGKCMERRTMTKRRVSKDDDRCPFCVTVFQDSTSFFLKGGIGHGFHQYHTKEDPNLEMKVSKRLLDPNELDLLTSLKNVSAGPTVGQTMYFTRHKSILSRKQVAHIINEKEDELVSPTENIFAFLKNEKANYCCLYHHVSSNELKENNNRKKTAGAKPSTSIGGLVNESHVISDIGNEEVDSQAIASFDLSGPDVDNFARSHRIALNVDDEQDLMIAIAWVTQLEQRKFILFPSVLFVDTTMDTNVEKRPLLTVSGKDSSGKMYTVLRVILPNERAWAFNWVFQTVFPSILGRLNLAQVNAIITDGDSQETSQLDLAIARFMPRAKRIRCNWHIITKGWESHCPGERSIINQNRRKYYKPLKQKFLNWLYSWSWHGCCETREEFMLSKALFVQWIKSNQVIGLFGVDGARVIHGFFRNHVEPLEAFFSAYKTNSVFHLEQASNTPHEGTNKGIKYCSLAALPQHRIDKTVRMLTTQAQIKNHSDMIRTTTQSNSTQLWSSLPTNGDVTNLCEGLLMSQWGQRHSYKLIRTDQYKWLAARSDQKELETGKGYPVFHRVRRILRCDITKKLSCTCCFYQRVGIPCRHMLAVLCFIDPNYKGPTKKDVKVFWWSDLVRFGMSMNDEHAPMRNDLIDLHRSEMIYKGAQGPYCPDLLPMPHYDSVESPGFEKYNKPATERCRNYNESACVDAMNSSAISNSNELAMAAPHGMSQEISINHCNDDNLDDINNEVKDDEVSLSSGDLKNMDLENQQKNYYGILVPITKDICNVLQHNVSDTEFESFKQALLQLHSNAVALVQGRKKQTSQKGRFVSSNKETNKKRKTHGNKYVSD